MYVETWLHFREFLEAIFTGLSKGDQKYAALLFPFIDNNKNKNTGLVQSDLDNVIAWLNNNVLPSAGYAVRGDVYQSINFLAAINKGRAASSCYSIAGCSFWGNHWYDGGCHTERKFVPVVEPEPEPEPEPVIDEERPFKPIIEPEERDCSEWVDRGTCLKMGCYWDGRECVRTLPNLLANRDDFYNSIIWEYGVDRVIEMINKAEDRVYYWEGESPYGWEYAMDAAMLEVELERYFEWAMSDISGWMWAVKDVIGDISKIEGTTIVREIVYIEEDIGDMSKIPQSNLVDAILAVEGAEETVAMDALVNLTADLGYSIDVVDGEVKRRAGYFVDNLQKIVDALIDEQGGVNVATISLIREMLEDDYKITTGTIDTIYALIETLFMEVTAVIETIVFKIDTDLISFDETAFDWLPASYGWVKNAITQAGMAILVGINEAMQPVIDLLNAVAETVYEMPDWWIVKLKERLGI